MPESIDSAASHPGAIKLGLLQAIEQHPRRSAHRRAAYFAMHEHLTRMRQDRAAILGPALQEVEHVPKMAEHLQAFLRVAPEAPERQTVQALLRSLR